jgi:TATA-box binding protein (TBP) (component of TFIID and TFIIIB)
VIIGAAYLHFHDKWWNSVSSTITLVVQTLYHTAKVNCNGAANIKDLTKMVQQTFCSTYTYWQVDD